MRFPKFELELVPNIDCTGARQILSDDILCQGWPTFHLPCVNFLLYDFRCATISINPGASISLPCRVCLQKQRFVRGCKLRVITTTLQCATSNHAMRHLMAHAPQHGNPCSVLSPALLVLLCTGSNRLRRKKTFQSKK